MREFCDLTHYVTQEAKIGRLTCLDRIPVLAGDSLSYNSSMFIRMSQLRRPLAADIKCDVYAFYCPYRYSYGSDWIEYMETGGKENKTFGTYTSENDVNFLCFNGKKFPKHLWNDYANIYNFWFRDPHHPEFTNTPPLTGRIVTIPAVTRTERYISGYSQGRNIEIPIYSTRTVTVTPARTVTYPSNTDLARFGFTINNLKGWGSIQADDAGVTTDDEEFDAPSTSTVNFYDIQKSKSKLVQEQLRSYISTRYTDLIESLSNAPVDDNIDNRPELLGQASTWLSGHDINGTTGADFGATVGKAVGALRFKMPRKFFSEHGTVYLMAALRLPPQWNEAVQYLDQFDRPFEEVCPVPSSNYEPKDLKHNDFFTGTSTVAAGSVPFAHWYRFHPNYIGTGFHRADDGWQGLPTPSDQFNMTQCADYDFMFQTTKLGHAQIICHHKLHAWRPLPDALDSIMGGGI